MPFGAILGGGLALASGATAATALGAAGLGLAAGSAIRGQNAAEDAAQIQADAARDASATQLNMFNKTEANMKPFMEGGLGGFNALKGLLVNPNGTLNQDSVLTKPFTFQDYQESPYFKFINDQGIDAMQNAASRSGMSGNVLKALTKYGQDVAGEDFQQQYSNATGRQSMLYNMLQNLATTGQNSAAQTGTMGANVANQIGQNTINAGTSRAAGVIGGQASLSNGVNSLLTNPNINWNSLFSSSPSNDQFLQSEIDYMKMMP